MNQMILCRSRRPHRGQARSYSGMCLPIDDRSAIGAGGADDDRARFCINARGAGTTQLPVGARLPANAAGRPLQVLELT